LGGESATVIATTSPFDAYGTLPVPPR